MLLHVYAAAPPFPSLQRVPCPLSQVVPSAVTRASSSASHSPPASISPTQPHSELFRAHHMRGCAAGAAPPPCGACPSKPEFPHLDCLTEQRLGLTDVWQYSGCYCLRERPQDSLERMVAESRRRMAQRASILGTKWEELGRNGRLRLCKQRNEFCTNGKRQAQVWGLRWGIALLQEVAKNQHNSSR